MGIIIIFLFMVLVTFIVAGSIIFYHFTYWILVKALHLQLNAVALWATICLLTNLISLYCLWLLLNDSGGDNPDPSLVWKFMMGVSVLLSLATYMAGLKMLKIP